MKIMKIGICNSCKFYRFEWPDVKQVSRFRCTNPESKRKNGNYRIINRDIAMGGKFPKWCDLEDYKNE